MADKNPHPSMFYRIWKLVPGIQPSTVDMLANKDECLTGHAAIDML
jgi:hypothetical protein